MGIIGRIRLNIIRRMNARLFGVSFSRRLTFDFPEKIVVNGHKIKLEIPRAYASKSIFTEIFLDDEYNIRKLKKKKIDTIIDIGAGFGMSALYLRNFFPNAKIHAYELNPICRESLSKHALYGNFDYFMKAVTAQGGRCEIDPKDRGWGKTRVISYKGGLTESISLKDCVERLGGYIDLAKIDIEGGEWELFKDKNVWSKINIVSIEYHLGGGPNKHSVRELKSRIRELGFKIKKIRAISAWTGMILAERARK